MPYRPLFSLNIQHEYYLSTECPDFSVQPTAECAELLKNYRLQWKGNRSGFQVYAQVKDDHTLFLPLSSGLTFSFLLRLNNPDFAKFTDLFASFGSQEVKNPVFFNAPSVNELEATELEAFQRDAFDFENGAATPGGKLRFILSNKTLGGTRLSDAGCTYEGDGIAEKLLPEDLEHKTPKKIFEKNVLQIDPDGVKKGRCALTYPIRPQLPWGSFAKVDIKVRDPDVFALFTRNRNPDNNFNIRFKAKAFYWKYWLIPEMAMDDNKIKFKNSSTLTPHRITLNLGGSNRTLYNENFSLGPVTSPDKRNLDTVDTFKEQVDLESNPDMETNALNRFYNDVVAIEKKIGLANFTRYFIASTEAIPCREKYAEYPVLEVNIAGKYSANFTLLPPPAGTDKVQVIRVRDTFKEPASST
jgi:hypothetical protein